MYLYVHANEPVPSRLLYRTQETTNEHTGTYLPTCCYTLPLSATNFQEKEGGGAQILHFHLAVKAPNSPQLTQCSSLHPYPGPSCTCMYAMQLASTA